MRDVKEGRILEREWALGQKFLPNRWKKDRLLLPFTMLLE
jgi:hypothetical protein